MENLDDVEEEEEEEEEEEDDDDDEENFLVNLTFKAAHTTASTSAGSRSRRIVEQSVDFGSQLGILV